MFRTDIVQRVYY